MQERAPNKPRNRVQIPYKDFEIGPYQITPEIDLALRKAHLDSVVVLGIIPYAAQGIEAPPGGETPKSGSTEGESPVGNADAPKRTDP
jgi:hypothetical protein